MDVTAPGSLLVSVPHANRFTTTHFRVGVYSTLLTEPGVGDREAPSLMGKSASKARAAKTRQKEGKGGRAVGAKARHRKRS
jgi:hypothetical protein